VVILVFPEDEPVYGLMGPYPLPDDRHYYGLTDASPFVHTGDVPPSDYVPPAEGEDYVPPPPPPEVSPDRDAIVLIQSKVGATPTGVFDEETVGQVIAWRMKWMADEEEYVDLPAWLQMDVVSDPVPAVAGTQSIGT
jgi:hypothetical protein